MKNTSFIIVILLFIILTVGTQAPRAFPTEPFTINVPKGTSVHDLAIELKEKKVIKSKILFKANVMILSMNKGILAGDYRFNYQQGVISTAHRMVKGKQGQEKVRVVIPEGTNVSDMAYIYLKNLSDFNAARFVSLAKKYEGYLYPDTYYFLENARPEEVIRTMRDNFNKKLASIENELKAFGKPLEEIVTMASLVEKETYADENRKIVAGILWKRIADEMPLQVNAPFYYITGKRGGFTLDDLKIDSPYNTYLNKGLPAGPISNPSIATILDTIKPKSTPYYYYLTGRDGKMRYAESFDGHIANRNMYLR